MNISLLREVADLLVLLVNGKSFSSTKDFLAALKAIFWYLNNRCAGWPSENDWPLIIFNLYSHQLLEGGANRVPESSLIKWRRIRVILKAWMDKNIIPESPLPSSKKPKGRNREQLDDGSVLGETLEELPPATIDGVEVSKKSLRDLSYLVSDDEFFSEVQGRLQGVADVTFEVCTGYWADMQKGHELGREVIEQVSREELLQAIADPRWSEFQGHNGLHIADSRSERGVSFFLAAVEYYFFELRELHALSFVSCKRIPFLRGAILGHGKHYRMLESIRSATESKPQSIEHLLCRALGVLTTRDCSAAAGILIHEQPRFTAEGIECADLFDKNGKYLLETVDEAGTVLSFTIAKHRARRRKGGALTEVASDVLRAIVGLTEKLRARVDFEQPHVAKRLLLVATRHGFGHAGRIGTYFNSKIKPCVYDFRAGFLKSKGYPRKTFTLSKIRNTQGILTWLQTGSMLAASVVMGNGVKVVRDNYMPIWVQRKLLARTVRRVQQMVIVLGTANKEWSLGSSDFVNFEEYEKFVESILSASNARSPLHDEFRKIFSVESLKTKAEGMFYVSLTPESLAALEVYVRHVVNKAVRDGALSGSRGVIGNSTLIDLYELISAIVHGSANGETEEIIHDLMSGGSRAQLKSMWIKSRKYLAFFQSKVNSLGF
ncbi:hypothetical protein [Pseudomonas putida]|uniref:hypothetical protein n=1 Tax=Pseudomonas putida TaxID=303 RepID=UPI00128E0483|nr:hypothetical protein [Pseudomonas putida]